jgi:hypothetical protein
MSQPTATPQPTPTEKPVGSGVEGSVVWNPPCRKATPPCGAASRLLNGSVWAERGTTVAARTHTSDYRFVLTVAPGSYTIKAKPDDPSYPSCTPVVATVPPREYVNVGIECQSK